MRIAQIQDNARGLSKKHGWHGDAAEALDRMRGEVEELSQGLEALPIDDSSVAFEIYDVIWNACNLANRLGIELEPFFREKERINSTRTWVSSK